ncbi:hypothetical protein A2415_04335 [candidate division WWE3 bacterium RIFOXYC1_FULL_39_7]|uniref:DUF458 domain-containing protein n=1 Tax=candidate division WWE3 bacterium RIFOXYC1_FULL_39_7 TaxID=1802643 RepID=A0A1F4WLM5_UNCKA|nr:MAG: hypothetical protein A2415_04335 [candidate division WWE3 bacterium RIFOXYC1_FULL_39_7]
MKIREKSFFNPTLGEVTVAQMIKEISRFVQEDSESFYRLVIGTDSQGRRVKGRMECNYVTAIVIHRMGKGAKYFWQREMVKGKIILRDKIYSETQRSLETAQTLVPNIRKVISPAKYDLEIHIDVGSLGPTREMIKEVVGMVSGNGFVAKTKPESWAASSVADKHT